MHVASRDVWPHVCCIAVQHIAELRRFYIEEAGRERLHIAASKRAMKRPATSAAGPQEAGSAIAQPSSSLTGIAVAVGDAVFVGVDALVAVKVAVRVSVGVGVWENGARNERRSKRPRAVDNATSMANR
jgi:hypothetical protein